MCLRNEAQRLTRIYSWIDTYMQFKFSKFKIQFKAYHSVWKSLQENLILVASKAFSELKNATVITTKVAREWDIFDSFSNNAIAHCDMRPKLQLILGPQSYCHLVY